MKKNDGEHPVNWHYAGAHVLIICLGICPSKLFWVGICKLLPPASIPWHIRIAKRALFLETQSCL